MKLRHLVVPLALLVGGAASADVPKPPARAPAKEARRIAIAVTQHGFDPKDITVPAKQPVTLVFTRRTDATCARSVVLVMDDGKKLERDLPLDKPVELAVTFPKAGKLAYACSMDMVRGFITVQ